MNYRKRNKRQRRSYRRAGKKVLRKFVWVARDYSPKNKLRTFRVTNKGLPRKIQVQMDDLPIGDFFYCEKNPYWRHMREWEARAGIRKCGDGYEVEK